MMMGGVGDIEQGGHPQALLSPRGGHQARGSGQALRGGDVNSERQVRLL